MKDLEKPDKHCLDQVTEATSAVTYHVDTVYYRVI